MNWTFRRLFLFAIATGLLLVGDFAHAQRVVRSGAHLRSLAELTLLKKRADSGDLASQLALARAYVVQSRPLDALVWYRKAAAQGSVEGASLAGDFLVFGKRVPDKSQHVIAKPEEGLPLIYFAATNRYMEAWHSMSIALQRGLGTRTNLVEAYAWLRLYAEADSAHRKKELDELGLLLSVEQLDVANQLSIAFGKGRWSPLNDGREPKGDPRLVLSGVAVGGRYPVAIINRRTLAEGETALVQTKGGTLSVKCLKVSADSVLVEIDQEPEPRLLSLY